MIRIHKSKFNILFVLMILLIHTLLAPLAIFASDSEPAEALIDPIKTGVITSDNDEKIPLYEEIEDGIDHSSDDPESSNILIYLKNKDKVEVMEELEQYSFIQFTETIDEDEADNTDEQSQVWQGYIENQYLQIEQEDAGETNSDQKNDSTEEDKAKDQGNTNDDTDLDTLPSENEGNEEDGEDPETDLDEEIEDNNEDPETDLDEENEENSEDTETDLDEEIKEDGEDPETDLDEEIEEDGEDPETDLDEEIEEDGEDPETDLDEEIEEDSEDTETDLDEEIEENNEDSETDLDEDKVLDEKRETSITSKFKASTLNVKSYRGVAKKDKTNIRTEPSTKVDILKSVPIGTILTYETYNDYWYKVSIDGKTGYIHKKHVENAVNNQESLRGVALKSTTNVRDRASTKAKVAHTFQIGTVIEYKTFSEHWYEVVYDGNKLGYIHKKHVENATANQENFRGVALKSPTNIRTLPSTKTKVIATYSQGSVISYKTFNTYWYEVSMIINGELRHGFVHKKHVENAVSKQKSIKGVTLKSPTNIRKNASTKASVAKTYPIGSGIEYKTFSKYWYEVFESGKSIGFVHKKHVYESTVTKQETLRGVALKSATNIRSAPSTSVKVAKRLKIGTVFEYKTFSEYWYEVFENGRSIGFVHKNHVENATVKEKSATGIGLRSPTNIRTLPSTKSDVLTTFSKGSIIKYKTFNKYWNVVTVTVNGEKRTGFIHEKHFGDPSSTEIGSTDYDLTLKEALDIQMKATPQTDKKYAWVSKDFISNNTVTASNLNVRPRPGTGTDKSFNPIGTLPKGAVVEILDEYNGWYAIKYDSGGQWRHAGPSDVMYYLNPSNFINDSIQRFQFLDLARTSGASKEVLNNYLKGKGILSGKAEAFIEAGRKHGINDVYLISHAILETGNGKSVLANGVKYNGVTVYNMYGIGAYDSCPNDCGAKHAYEQGWTSPEKAIIDGARFIGNSYIKAGQNTLYKMRWNPAAMESSGRFGKQYATDIGWASKQINTMYNLYQTIGLSTLHLDVPVYK